MFHGVPASPNDNDKSIVLRAPGRRGSSSVSSTVGFATPPDTPFAPSPSPMLWLTPRQVQVAQAAQTLLDALRDVNSDFWRDDLASVDLSAGAWTRQLLTVVERLESAAADLTRAEAREEHVAIDWHARTHGAP
eukprot:TRINITY_DN1217_c0_g6_i1.p1 TRINITY_DN1217_c0_g6~~TRINITY_DN1217_c0_g6_i1.p1  ORF type:complete len:134 (+),score=28.09 TRINITY_DN1217_c0_g6_i1:65-466(+)